LAEIKRNDNTEVEKKENLYQAIQELKQKVSAKTQRLSRHTKRQKPIILKLNV